MLIIQNLLIPAKSSMEDMKTVEDLKVEVNSITEELEIGLNLDTEENHGDTSRMKRKRIDTEDTTGLEVTIEKTTPEEILGEMKEIIPEEVTEILGEMIILIEETETTPAEIEMENIPEGWMTQMEGMET